MTRHLSGWQRRSRQWLGGCTVGAGVCTAFMLATVLGQAQSASPCAGARRQIATVWPGPDADVVRARIEADHGPAVAHEVTAWVDGAADLWVATMSNACVIETDVAQTRRRLQCLWRMKGAFAAFTEQAREGGLADPVAQAHRLPDARRCVEPEPPRDPETPPQLAVATHPGPKGSSSE